jgi:gliding motility-associated-like protein
MDDNGCVATDLLTVFVNHPDEVFIPNAFSPNNDGINDVLMVFAGEDVAVIKSFLVFNRWGETVFDVYNFPPNDPAFGWDGDYRSKRYNNAVFVYMAEVEFIDGTVKLFKGDVAIIK